MNGLMLAVQAWEWFHHVSGSHHGNGFIMTTIVIGFAIVWKQTHNKLLFLVKIASFNTNFVWLETTEIPSLSIKLNFRHWGHWNGARLSLDWKFRNAS